MSRKTGSPLRAAILLVLLVALIGAAVYLAMTNFGEQSSGGSTGGQTSGGQSSGNQTGEMSSGQSKLGVGVTIEFVDGSVQEVDPSQIKFTLFPLTVYFEGKPVRKITWHCFVYLDWSGQLTSLELKGPMEVKTSTGIQLRKEVMLRRYSTDNPPPKGQWFDMWSFTLEDLDIEYGIGASGDYTLVCTVSVTASATFSSGASSSKSASASSNLPIRLETAGLMVLQCDVQVQMFK